MFTYRFNSMSTNVVIVISHELANDDMESIYQLFELIEMTCSRFRNDSELSLLNAQIDKEIVVSPSMFSILTEAEKVYWESNGFFNPGILSALENNGYRQSIEFVRGQTLEMLSRPVGIQSLPYTLNEVKQTVILNTRIDLGGIAKGWVIDRASQLLEQYGNGFINVGGDIRIFGTLPRPLNIGIEHPMNLAHMISSVHVSGGAIATSTSAKRKWFVDGELKHHLIDPKTGDSSESYILSATVTAPTAVEADVWAKVILLLGVKDGPIKVKEKRLGAVLINQNCQIWRGGDLNGNV